jgi:UDP-N-acetylmuramoyl-L-alanyl-D-glutamate--2,6-diaminopimelate ligase
LSYDIREVKKGDLFAALDGAPFRGHTVVSQAVDNGAAAVLAGREVGCEVPMLYAQDPRSALARIAAAFHGWPSRRLDVIGVTGTDGKTTTAHLIQTIFETAKVPSGSVTTVGTRIVGQAVATRTRLTTPESPEVQELLSRMLSAGARWAVLEATSHGLALNRLDDVQIAIGAITNVTHEHLDFHRTPNRYRRAKAILLERARDCHGTAVVNGDDPGAMATLALAGPMPAIRYAVDAEAEVRATQVRIGPRESRFTLTTPAGAAPVCLPLPARFNLANALCAAAATHAAGLGPQVIAEGLGSALPVPGRLAVIDQGQPFEVIVDYAHTPAAVQQVLTLLRDRRPKARLIVVLGSAGQRDLLKRPWLGEIAEQLADYSVFTSEDPRMEDPEAIVAEVAVGAVSAGGRDGRSFACVADRRAAIEHALEHARPGDCVALLGKGHERSIVWGHEERAWDEAGVARAVLSDLGY